MGVGEIPDWHPTDIVEESENLLDDIEKFMKNVLKDNIDVEDYTEYDGEDY